MGEASSFFLLALFSYLLGSVPFGLIISKRVQNIDIREHGSGNIGATNILRSMGPVYGVIVLVLDMGKGLAVIGTARYMEVEPAVMLLSGFLVVCGHCFPIFLRFKGGKGVATALGVLLLMPDFLLPVLSIIVIFVVIVALTRYVSLGSITAAVLIPVTFLILNFTELFEYTWEHVIFGVGVSAVLIVRHRDNIRKLLQGTESKIGNRQ